MKIIPFQLLNLEGALLHKSISILKLMCQLLQVSQEE